MDIFREIVLKKMDMGEGISEVEEDQIEEIFPEDMMTEIVIEGIEETEILTEETGIEIETEETEILTEEIDIETETEETEILIEEMMIETEGTGIMIEEMTTETEEIEMMIVETTEDNKEIIEEKTTKMMLVDQAEDQ